MHLLPAPEVLRCFFERSFDPQLPAMELRWDPDTPGVADRVWYLPDNVCLQGPAPERFGVTIVRQGENSYQLRILWNRLCLSWHSLPRSEMMASSLSLVLDALGTDLWYLLSQPVQIEPPAQAA